MKTNKKFICVWKLSTRKGKIGFLLFVYLSNKKTKQRNYRARFFRVSMSRRSLSVHHSSAGRKLPVITKTKINCNSDVGCASFLTKKKEISSCSFLILFNSSVTLCLLPGTLPLKVILCTPILLKKKNLKFSTICLLQSQKVNFLIPKLKLFFKLKKKVDRVWPHNICTE